MANIFPYSHNFSNNCETEKFDTDHAHWFCSWETSQVRKFQVDQWHKKETLKLIKLIKFALRDYLVHIKQVLRSDNT